MAKAYVKFETPKDVSEKALEAIRLAKKGGVVRKGVNEVTKSVERGLATLVVLAEDVEPEEVVMHLPGLCEQKNIALVYTPAKLELGKAAGLSVTCAAIAVEKPGEAQSAVSEVVAKTTGKAPRAVAPVAPKAAPAPKKEKAPAKATAPVVEKKQ